MGCRHRQPDHTSALDARGRGRRERGGPDFPPLCGPLEALSEREAQQAFPGPATIIRPGLIVGVGEPSDRFTYWPLRIARGGEVLAPPANDPVQLIDARDLGEWVIRLKATLAFYQQQTEERKAQLRAGLSAEREAQVLAERRARG